MSTKACLRPDGPPCTKSALFSTWEIFGQMNMSKMINALKSYFENALKYARCWTRVCMNSLNSRSSRYSGPCLSSPDDAFLAKLNDWRQLYKNRSPWKIDSRIIFLREYGFLKTFSLTENQFSRKTFFIQLPPAWTT